MSTSSARTDERLLSIFPGLQGKDVSDIRFNWERYWCPRGSSLNLSDDGYLPDPNSRPGRISNPELVSLSKIYEAKALVLLGDPGMGKSTVLSDQESLLKSKPSDASDRHLFLNLRSYQTDSQLTADIFDSPILKEWLAGTHTLYLYLDSLDEGLLSIKVLAALLVDKLKKLPPERLKVRIACRTVEWPNLLERGSRRVAGRGGGEVLRVSPFEEN